MGERVFDDESEAFGRIDDWERSIADRAARAQDFSSRTAALTSVARSADGSVEVTVGSDGQLVDLHLSERTRNQSAQTTAREILDLLQEAREDLLRQIGAAAADTIGSDSDTGRAVLTSMEAKLGRNNGDRS